MTTKRKTTTTPTQAQQNARDRFRQAAHYAKQLLLDPERKRHYTELAREQRLPNAYVAAVTEYLRTTPLMKIIGSVKRAIQSSREQTQIAKVIPPKVMTARKPQPRKTKKRKVAAVFQMEGLSVGFACTGNIKASKMKVRKSRSGSVTFSSAFYFD